MRIEVSVEHPVLAGNELLDEKIRRFTIFRFCVELGQFATRVDQKLRAASAATQTLRIGCFHHHGKNSRLDEPRYVELRMWHKGSRDGHAMLLGQLLHAALITQPADQ